MVKFTGGARMEHNSNGSNNVNSGQLPPPLPSLGVVQSFDNSSSDVNISTRDYQQQLRQAQQHPAIYAVPTTETFGDDSSSLSLHMRLVASSSVAIAYANTSTAQTPPRHHGRPLTVTSGSATAAAAAPPRTAPGNHRAAAGSGAVRGQRAEHVNKNNSKSSSSTRTSATTSATTTTPQRSGEAQNRPAAVRRRRLPTNSKQGQNRDFQYEQDLPTVSIKYVNIANRSAYEINPCPSVEQWHDMAHRLESIKQQKRNVVNMNSIHKRISPSLQHLQLLQTMQRQAIIRQVDFSPSCGYNADYLFLDNHDDNGRGHQAETANGKKKKRNSVTTTTRRHHDGRYRPILVRQASLESLPAVAPVLSHTKLRLPFRADVGFPRALPDEITQKQLEILHETQWEEATPRLIAIITSDFLGTAVVDDMEYNGSNNNNISSSTALHLQWNGGGLEGMPFCGREIIRAKEWNASQWGRRRHSQQRNNSTSIATSTTTEDANNNATAIQFHDVLKPNPYSMLAPPLDATYSKSQHWRPRPFHDRPAGRIYALVCPTLVEFAVGDLEPLVASLTLYTLPVVLSNKSHHDGAGDRGGSSSNRKSAVAFGKISEDFWFPVGDWKGMVDLDAVRRVDGSIDEGLLASWFDRKSKAIFSYDPLTLPKEGGRESLHVVLQIYKLAHMNATDVYTKSKQRAAGGDTGTATADPPAIDPATLRQRVDRCFQQYGAKLLTPLCFGVAKLYNSSSNGEGQQQWPRGTKQDIQLYAYPAVPESVYAFVDRLSSISTGRVPTSERNASPEVEHVRETQSEVNGAHETPSKRRMVSRLFRSPAKAAPPRSQSLPRSDLAAPKPEPEEMIDGHASLFVSALGVDFLESMLTTPPELKGLQSRDDKDSSSSLPSLLTDPTGEVAVVLGASQRVNSLPQGAQKRSDLVRLPVLSSSAGYIEASEFREVLSLTARREKHYDTDTPLSYRSLVNLLYLYPRSLRLLTDSSTPYRNSLTVRIRLIHNEASIDKNTGNSVSRNIDMKSLHPWSSWVCPGLVDTVFTKIWEDSGSGENVDLTAGVPLNDEIKIQLPMMIDGSFTLQFVLFSVDLTPDAGASLTQISETLIPLSSLSKQDAASGGKVTTVIPNGNHRLRLGDFQLQIESRLISSVHIGDPSVALTLRDYPYVKPRQDNDEQGTEMLLGYAKSNSQSVDSVAEFNESFPSLLTAASATSVVAHFQLLLHMHLSNLVNLRDKQQHGDFGNEARFLVGNMLSLFELLRKVKASPINHGEVSDRSLACFVKSQIDAFDEGILSPASSRAVPNDASESTLDTDDLVHVNPKASHDDTPPPPEHETPGGGVMHRHRRTSFVRQHDVRVSRIIAALGASGIPFSRIAYGASKTDRMRVEAELKFEVATLDHFFDDDETIATSSTFQVASMTTPREENKSYHRRDSFAKLSSSLNSLKSSISMDDSIMKSSMKSSISMDDNTNNSIIREAAPGSSTPKGHKKTQSSKSIGDTDFAKRVKSAAHVMLAPCVGPAISNMLASTRSSSSFEENNNPGESSPVATPLFDTVKPKKKLTPASLLLCCPGSDLEEDVTDDLGDGEQLAQIESGGILRGPSDGPLLMFSIDIHGRQVDDLPVTSGEYLYETLILMWLRAWVDHVQASMNKTPEKSRVTGRHGGTFVIPEYDPSLPTTNGNIFAFHAHMDFLLPLCLKSIALRFSIEAATPLYPPSIRAILDDSHMLVLEPFVETLARGLIGQTLASLGSPHDHEKSLLRALSSADLVLEFLVGLVAVLHPEHINLLLSTYLNTLRDCETEHLGGNLAEINFEWTEENIHRVRCSRQLRLHGVEAFAVLPAFLVLNCPPKYTGFHRTKQPEKASWKNQYKDIEEEVAGSPKNDRRPVYQDGAERLPASGWLSDLLVTEALSVCSLSSEAVVAEVMAHVEVSRPGPVRPPINIASSLKKRPGAALKRADLLMFQSLSIQAITCVYELLLRRQSIDSRYQTESSRTRIAAMFAGPILEKSISSVRWLARMESTHKVRCTWLLCFVFILQEAPDVMIQDYVRSYCDPKDVRINRFIRLLRLCSSSFQGFVDHQSGTTLPAEVDAGVAAWLMQESFNTICATTNIVVDACVNLVSSYPQEQRKMMQGLLDLLLHILTTPQSSVTHLRAVGGALQAMERFGIELFLEIAGHNFQHWVRVILSLMNSISLSVRSISVDFVVSLFGSVFEFFGNIDEVALVFATVLPEVAAREIALYGVCGHIRTLDDVAKSLWPLRRAIADISDANPLDDDRVDPQLVPILAEFGRACQAVVDGVLIEMRLNGRKLAVLGDDFRAITAASSVFDADEESIFEAASFFLPETGSLQRVRWLLTLRLVHESKEQWVEAAETLMLCSRTIMDSAPHFKSLWRPSRFTLWSDTRRSAWLETVGEELGHPDRGNAQVMDLAEEFLEPDNVLGFNWKKQNAAGTLPQPSIPTMCELLIKFTKEAITLYLKEDGMEELAHGRLETFQKSVMHVLEIQSRTLLTKSFARGANAAARRRYVEEEAALRKLLASVSAEMTNITLRLLTKDESLSPSGASVNSIPRYLKSPRNNYHRDDGPVYVLMRLSGNKPLRFEESTTLPTFLEWGESCICRVTKSIMNKANMDGSGGFSYKSAEDILQSFAQPFLRALETECSASSVTLCTKPQPVVENEDPNVTYLQVFLVDPSGAELGPNQAFRLLSRRFFYRQELGKGRGTSLIEITVAEAFPFALARQRTVLTTETKTIPK